MFFVVVALTECLFACLLLSTGTDVYFFMGADFTHSDARMWFNNVDKVHSQEPLEQLLVTNNTPLYVHN